MVLVPPGEASIGSPEYHLDSLPNQQHFDRVWFEDEAPQHSQPIPPFWIDRHPVTNAQFAEFIAATNYVTAAERRGFGLVYGRRYWQKEAEACWQRPGGSTDSIADRMDHPVVHVDHDDASCYAKWARKRLPTEPEWEYAAHGPRWSCWPWGDTWEPHRANTAEFWAGVAVRDSDDWRAWWKHHFHLHGTRPGTSKVGDFSPLGDSRYGLADMAGNVAEWTASLYEPYASDYPWDPGYYAAMKQAFLVVRGGSWKSFRFQVRTSERIACDSSYSSFDVGFRCAANVEPAAV
ncbi:MAG TPA: SUMF1/EgtB/PvdO family nonheme iron enzyme [Gammaproteobacteria bacterium]|nr:SUMF1/EgtB/PvdO family nonheme iron enzyme [Gammaproteobacteria bacterium]